jgi:hypothetical protein
VVPVFRTSQRTQPLTYKEYRVAVRCKKLVTRKYAVGRLHVLLLQQVVYLVTTRTFYDVCVSLGGLDEICLSS